MHRPVFRQDKLICFLCLSQTDVDQSDEGCHRVNNRLESSSSEEDKEEPEPKGDAGGCDAIPTDNADCPEDLTHSQPKSNDQRIESQPLTEGKRVESKTDPESSDTKDIPTPSSALAASDSELKRLDAVSERHLPVEGTAPSATAQHKVSTSSAPDSTSLLPSSMALNSSEKQIGSFDVEVGDG